MDVGLNRTEQSESSSEREEKTVVGASLPPVPSYTLAGMT